MARSLDTILKELDAGYNPGREQINQRIAALPGQAQSEMDALKAQEQDYFDNTIMTGARSRGLGFSGIPDGERARYGSTQYLPAIARVKQAQEETRSSLLGALNDINLDQRKTAMNIYQREQDRAAQTAAANRQFNLLGGGAGGDGGGGGAPGLKEQAMSEVAAMLARRGGEDFYREIYAINKSAKYGNAKDQAKLELLAAQQPGLFKDGQLNEANLQKLIMLANQGKWR